MNILHLADTGLSGSPIRIVDLLNKYTPHKARFVIWDAVTHFRTFKTDVVAPRAGKESVAALLEWADIVHYHNRWRRQKVFTEFGLEPPKKKSVIQIHSPRESENFSAEVSSGIPLAIIAQYHVRQWPEVSYVVPNVVDIWDPAYRRLDRPKHNIPVVSYAPSNWNARGWDDKGYGVVSPILKRMGLSHEIKYDLIIKQPHQAVMERKRVADIGIDEIVTGSYHLSSLEYLSLGVPCFAHLDVKTAEVVKELTGAERLPWIDTTKTSFQRKLAQIIGDRSWDSLGTDSREWMESYWKPEFLAEQYISMYEDLK